MSIFWMNPSSSAREQRPLPLGSARPKASTRRESPVSVSTQRGSNTAMNLPRSLLACDPTVSPMAVDMGGWLAGGMNETGHDKSLLLTSSVARCLRLEAFLQKEREPLRLEGLAARRVTAEKEATGPWVALMRLSVPSLHTAPSLWTGLYTEF